jgi:hypothetical protein
MNEITAWIGQRRKAFQALGSVVLTWATVVIGANGDLFGHVSSVEWLSLAVGIGGVVGVHALTNDPVKET